MRGGKWGAFEAGENSQERHESGIRMERQPRGHLWDHGVS